jgi:hypothetical protein
MRCGLVKVGHLRQLIASVLHFKAMWKHLKPKLKPYVCEKTIEVKDFFRVMKRSQLAELIPTEHGGLTAEVNLKFIKTATYFIADGVFTPDEIRNILYVFNLM